VSLLSIRVMKKIVLSANLKIHKTYQDMVVDMSM